MIFCFVFPVFLGPSSSDSHQL